MASGGWTTTTFSHFFLVPLNYEVGNVIALFRTPKLIRGTSGHKYIHPKAIHDSPEIVEEYSKDYIYFACIAFINSARLSPSSLSAVDVDALSLIQIETASLQWHSPMLNDISAVSLLLHLFSSWSFPLYFAGKNMGQSQFRHAQNVPCRSPQQAPSNLTFPLRLIPPLRRASAASATACYISSIRAFHVLETPDITYGAWGPRART